MKLLLLLASTLLPNTISQELCSCSPTQYTFRLELTSNCDTSTISDETDGINGSLCFFGDATGLESILPGDMVLGGKGGVGPITKSGYRIFPRGVRRRLQSSSAPVLPITEVTSILFLEVDTSPELNIINQDSTYFSSNLSDGSLVTYDSVSKKLDYTVPLEDQMDLVPGGVVIVLFGTDEEGNTVQNTVAWDYSGTCEGEPLKEGDTIGWIVLNDYATAKAAFCPVVEAPPPTPQPTVAVSLESTDQPTEEPIASTPVPSVVTNAPVTDAPSDPQTEPPTDKVMETVTPSVTVIETNAPSLPPVKATDSPAGSSITTTAPASKSTKNPATSISKSSKEMSVADAKASKKIGDMSMTKEAKSGKAEPNDSMSMPSSIEMSVSDANAGKSSKDGDAKAHKANADMSIKQSKSGKTFGMETQSSLEDGGPSKLFPSKTSKPDLDNEESMSISMSM